MEMISFPDENRIKLGSLIGLCFQIGKKIQYWSPTWWSIEIVMHFANQLSKFVMKVWLSSIARSQLHHDFFDRYDQFGTNPWYFPIKFVIPIGAAIIFALAGSKSQPPTLHVLLPPWIDRMAVSECPTPTQDHESNLNLQISMLRNLERALT